MLAALMEVHGSTAESSAVADSCVRWLHSFVLPPLLATLRRHRAHSAAQAQLRGILRGPRAVLMFGSACQLRRCSSDTAWRGALALLHWASHGYAQEREVRNSSSGSSGGGDGSGGDGDASGGLLALWDSCWSKDAQQELKGEGDAEGAEVPPAHVLGLCQAVGAVRSAVWTGRFSHFAQRMLRRALAPTCGGQGDSCSGGGGGDGALLLSRVVAHALLLNGGEGGEGDDGAAAAVRNELLRCTADACCVSDGALVSKEALVTMMQCSLADAVAQLAIRASPAPPPMPLLTPRRRRQWLQEEQQLSLTGVAATLNTLAHAADDQAAAGGSTSAAVRGDSGGARLCRKLLRGDVCVSGLVALFGVHATDADVVAVLATVRAAVFRLLSLLLRCAGSDGADSGALLSLLNPFAVHEAAVSAAGSAEMRMAMCFLCECARAGENGDIARMASTACAAVALPQLLLRARAPQRHSLADGASVARARHAVAAGRAGGPPPPLSATVVELIAELTMRVAPGTSNCTVAACINAGTVLPLNK